MAYHLISRYALAFVARMGRACVGKVKRCVDFGGGHWRIHGIDLYPLPAVTLPQSLAVHRITLLLDMLEVLSLGPLVFETPLIAVEHYVGRSDIYPALLTLHSLRSGNGAYHRLRQIGDVGDAAAGVKNTGNLHYAFLTHAVGYEVGFAVEQQRRTQTVLPIIIV